MNDRVSITVTDQIADVRLTRGDKMNAIDPAMFEGIGAAIDWLAGVARRALRRAVGRGPGVLRRARHGEHGGGRLGAVVARSQRTGRDPAAACHLGLAQPADAGDRRGPRRRVRRRVPDHVGRRHPHRRAGHALRDPRSCIGGWCPTWRASRCGGRWCATMCCASWSIPRANSMRPRRWRMASSPASPTIRMPRRWRWRATIAGRSPHAIRGAKRLLQHGARRRSARDARGRDRGADQGDRQAQHDGGGRRQHGQAPRPCSGSND